MKKSKYTVIKVITAAIVAIGAVALLGMWIATKNIEAVANQFKPDSSWKLESETIVPAKLCTAGSGPCPRVGRTWSTKTPVSLEQIQMILNESDWQDTVKVENPNCYHNSNDTHGSFACSAAGTVSGYDIMILTDFSDPILKMSTLTLYVN